MAKPRKLGSVIIQDLTASKLVATDANKKLVSVNETDPVVGAINGIVKANGAGVISAAVAGTDYQAPINMQKGNTAISWGAGATTDNPISFSPAFSSIPTVVATLNFSNTQVPIVGYIGSIFYINNTLVWTVKSIAAGSFIFRVAASANAGGTGSVTWIAWL